MVDVKSYHIFAFNSIDNNWGKWIISAY